MRHTTNEFIFRIKFYFIMIYKWVGPFLYPTENFYFLVNFSTSFLMP